MATDNQRSLVKLEDIRRSLHSSDSEVRLRAVRDLVGLRNPELIAILLEAQKSEADVQVRYEMRKGLAVLQAVEESAKNEEGPAPSGFTSNLKKVEESLKSRDLEQVNKAFRYIVQYRLKQFLPLMQTVSREHESPYQRSLIVRFMQSIGGENYFNEIVTYLADPDPRVVSTAIEALEAIGNTKALAYLTQCVTHEHNRVQASAMKALYKLGDENALTLFEKMVASPHPEYRNSAAYALKEMRIEKGVPLLSRLLKDSDPSVQSKAEEGLKRLMEAGSERAKTVLEGGGEAAFPAVEGTLPYPLSAPLPERLEWIQACHELESSRAAEAVVQACRLETDEKALASLVMGLGRIPHPKSTEEAKEFLNHPVDRVRANAVESLGLLLSSEECAEFLRPCLDDHNNRVVGNAVLVLCPVLEDEAMRALRFLVESSSRNEQLTGVFCIGALATDSAIQLAEALMESHHNEVRDKMLNTLETLARESSVADRLLKQNRLRMAAFNPNWAEAVSSATVEEAPAAPPPSSIPPKKGPIPTPAEPPRPKIKVEEKPPKERETSRSSPQAVAHRDDEDLKARIGFGAMFGSLALVVGIVIARFGIQDEQFFHQTVLYLAKAPLLFEPLHFLFWMILVPVAFFGGMAFNFPRISAIPLAAGALIGLFLFLWIPALGFLKLSSSQLFNVLGFYSASIWIQDPYSLSFHLARVLLNFPWLLLPVCGESFLRLEQRHFRILLGGFSVFLILSSGWLAYVNAGASARIQSQKLRDQIAFLHTRLYQLQELDDQARYRHLQMEARYNKAEMPEARRLAALKMQDIEEERQLLGTQIRETQNQLKQLQNE